MKIYSENTNLTTFSFEGVLAIVKVLDKGHSSWEQVRKQTICVAKVEVTKIMHQD